MGQKDLTEKSLLMNADVFADVVNAIVGGGGLPIVRAEALRPYRQKPSLSGEGNEVKSLLGCLYAGNRQRNCICHIWSGEPE